MKQLLQGHPVKCVVGLAIILALLWNAAFFSRHPSTAHDTVFDRVMHSGTLRCGYFTWKPFLIKDPNTGALSGIFYDYMNALGKSLSLKVEWVQEMGLGEFPAALNSGIVDAFCSGVYITGAKARAMDFAAPAFYVPLYAFARTSDDRFHHDISAINDQHFTMAVLEGGVTATIQEHQFPNTKLYSLPQLTSPAELFTSVAQNKADVAIYDLATYGDFNAHNPGQIASISDQPVKIFPLALAVKPGENEFRQMLSHATSEVQLSGEMEKIIRKYEAYPGSFYSVAPPYQK
jgi:ABC-type amino acid transport substrate-binding protein